MQATLHDDAASGCSCRKNLSPCNWAMYNSQQNLRCTSPAAWRLRTSSSVQPYLTLLRACHALKAVHGGHPTRSIGFSRANNSRACLRMSSLVKSKFSQLLFANDRSKANPGSKPSLERSLAAPVIIG